MKLTPIFHSCLSLILFFVLASGVCQALPNDRNNYEAAVTEASRDKKVLGLYFDKPGSDACLELKWKLIGKDRFEALTKGDLVFLMIQDRGSNQKGELLISEDKLQLENQYNVTSFPTFLLFTYDGKLIDRIDGFNWHEDEKADKYYARLQAAIERGKTLAGTNPGPAGVEQPANPLAGAKAEALPLGQYDGDVIFTFSDGTRLVSHRTIEVQNDQTGIRLDSTDYYEDEPIKKYVSKLIMRGMIRGNTYSSSEQQCLKTDYKDWLSENIKVEFSADGATASMTSVYQNNTGKVVGSGVLKREQ